MLFVQQKTVQFFFMINPSIRIILLFLILGSCKNTSTHNRAIGCTDKTLCWNQKEHLCLPCEQSSDDSSNDGSDDDSNSNSNSSDEGLNRIIGSRSWPPKIGGRDSLPPARTSLKNRLRPMKGTKEYDGCLDCLPKKNRNSGQGDCQEQGMCYLNITGKCIPCKDFVLEFAIALDMKMASKSGKQ